MKGRSVMEHDIPFIKIRQHFTETPPVFVEQEIRTQIAAFLAKLDGVKTVAIAVGSRGIRDLVPIISSLVRELQAAGHKPFVVASMGSHGGGTVDGQLEVLHNYGLISSELGVPVRASCEVTEIPGRSYGKPILVNSVAWSADKIIVVNRIKKHTDVHGEIESGLSKMIAIGLGNRQQAEKLHYAGLEHLRASIPLVASDVLATNKILFGAAVVENGYSQTAVVELIPPAIMIQREKELLAYAKKISPRLPTDGLDVLVIDRGGKDISGSCIETHIIGRMLLQGEEDLQSPRIKRIVLTDLTETSCGNAAGMGLADFITRKFYEKIEFSSTYTNGIFSYYPERCKMPLVMENDWEAFLTALKTSRNADVLNPRIIRIRDTLHLDYMYVSHAVFEEISRQPEIEKISEIPALFAQDGSLIPFDKV